MSVSKVWALVSGKFHTLLALYPIMWMWFQSNNIIPVLKKTIIQNFQNWFLTYYFSNKGFVINFQKEETESNEANSVSFFFFLWATLGLIQAHTRWSVRQERELAVRKKRRNLETNKAFWGQVTQFFSEKSKRTTNY